MWFICISVVNCISVVKMADITINIHVIFNVVFSLVCQNLLKFIKFCGSQESSLVRVYYVLSCKFINTVGVVIISTCPVPNLIFRAAVKVELFFLLCVKVYIYQTDKVVCNAP